MLNAFMPDADFAMLDYKTSGLTLYNTWLYEMSPTASGFVFASSQLAGNRYVANPCYNYTSLAATNTVYKDCLAIDGSGQVTGSVATSQYMQISASSDDPLINDVLYAGSEAPVCLVYGGPNPASPYTGYALSDYNSNPGNVRESYSHEINSCATATGPTNAGFVPYTPQTMYIQRGFGYGASQSATAATTLVSMTSAGSTPTAGTVATAIAKFTPFLAPETNSTSTTEIKASAGQSALPGLLKGANSYYSTANPPSSNGCAAKRYVILLTDGLPTLDLAGHSWPPPGTTSATNWGETVAFNADGSLSAAGTNDQAVIDTINQLAALNSGSSPVQTYVIGLGAGVDPTQNPTAANVLKAMAIAGGTSNYYAATSPTALTNDLQGIIVNILAATQSTASTAVSATSLRSGSTAYLVQFTTSDTYQDWTGDVIAYPIDPATGAVNTTPSAATWDAKTQLDAQDWDTGRVIATWDPVAGQGTPFRWNSALAPDGISATTGLGEALSTFSSDTNGSDVLNYLRGSSTLEQRNGGTFRNRAHKLGDIVDSAPLYVGAPSSASQSSSYFTFAAAHASREPLIYIGANDGMLHAFDAATGKERFAYVPNGVFNNLINLPNPYYNASHLYFVNGSPQAADVQFASDSSWHTVLAGTEGAGGHSVFALDITSADGITTEAQLAADVLWEFTDADMGLTYSAPAFANTSAGWLVLFGNGYNSTNQKPMLYALDPQKGTVVAKIDLCAAVAHRMRHDADQRPVERRRGQQLRKRLRRGQYRLCRRPGGECLARGHHEQRSIAMAGQRSLPDAGCQRQPSADHDGAGGHAQPRVPAAARHHGRGGHGPAARIPGPDDEPGADPVRHLRPADRIGLAARILRYSDPQQHGRADTREQHGGRRERAGQRPGGADRQSGQPADLARLVHRSEPRDRRARGDQSADRERRRRGRDHLPAQQRPVQQRRQFLADGPQLRDRRVVPRADARCERRRQAEYR